MKTLIIVFSFILTGCYMDVVRWDKAVELCKEHGGIAAAFTEHQGVEAVCKNGVHSTYTWHK
jgi:hypothetical protein